MEKKFYVYAYLDPRKKDEYVYSFGKKGKIKSINEIFYIGKGCDQRKFFHLDLKKCTNFRLRSKIVKIRIAGFSDPIIKTVKSGLTEKEALNLEKKIILGIGRRHLEEGSLTNFSDGGDGFSSKDMKILWKNETYRKNMLKNRSELRKKDWENPEYRKKQRKSRKKSWENENRRELISKLSSEARKEEWADPKMRKKRLVALEEAWKASTGRVKSKEERKAISERMKGKRAALGSKRSKEQKKKISNATKGKNNPFYGRRHSEETKQKMREARLKRVSS